MESKEWTKALTGYDEKFKPNFDLVFRLLKKEFEDNGVDDNFLRHIIKGWPHAEIDHPGIH